MERVSKAERMKVQHPELLQLFSVATPNGIKVAACLEELILLEFYKGADFDYEPHSVDIRTAENRTPEFRELNPNEKIPAIVYPVGELGVPQRVFESGAILLDLADNYSQMIPLDFVGRAETLKWLFWGSSSLSVQVKWFVFYYKYCPHKLPYCVDRYALKVKQLLHVLNKQLSHAKSYLIGDLYTIADISVWPWIHALHENSNGAVEAVFDNFGDLIFLKEWYQRCISRPASQKGLDVCPFLFPTA